MSSPEAEQPDDEIEPAEIASADEAADLVDAVLDAASFSLTGKEHRRLQAVAEYLRTEVAE